MFQLITQHKTTYILANVQHGKLPIIFYVIFFILSFSHSFISLITANNIFHYTILLKNLKMQKKKTKIKFKKKKQIISVCQLSWFCGSLKWVLRKNETDMMVFCSTIIAFAERISK